MNAHRLIAVTGCDSGFGLDTCIALALRGFTVLAGCLTSQGVAHLDSLKISTPSNAMVSLLGIKWDVTSADDLAKVCAVIDSMGGCLLCVHLIPDILYSCCSLLFSP